MTMFQRVGKHLTPSTLIAFAALVLALTGGAFAATGHSGGGASRPESTAVSRATAVKSGDKAARRGPRGASGPKGATGPKGAIGAAGAVGPAGPGGPTGATGASGARGEKGEPGAPGKNGQEGEEGTPGAAGKEGSPWTAGGTLPSGSTETGAWSGALAPTGAGTVEGIAISPISFPIHLAAPIDGFGTAGPGVHYVSSEEQEKGGPETSECKGNVEKPEASKGNLCLYEGAIVEPSGTDSLSVPITTSLSGSQGVNQDQVTSTSGALVYVRYEGPAGEARLSGSWAVTAP
jgi:hypothetical protein